MEIEYNSKKLRSFFIEEKKGRAAWGQLYVKIIQRHNEIQASPTLKDLYSIPAAKCEKLTGDRDGEYSVELNKNFRLIFEAVGDRESIAPKGVVDPIKVNKVKILEAKIDYHKK